MTKIQKKLFECEDKKYKVFQEKLNPTVKAGTIIGVRVPKLRALAKEIYSNGKEYDLDEFMNSLPHQYFEEYFIHSFIIERIKNFDECMNSFCRFLPYINSWAVCDTCHPKVFKKNADKVLVHANEWIKSTETYTVRYGIDVFMTYFLDEFFKKEYLDVVAAIRSDEYYVNMMQAWYFATALAKQWEDTITIIEERKLSPWVHNKSIQKARESFRVTQEHKDYLLTLKLKEIS